MEINEKIREAERSRNEHISYLQDLTRRLGNREITREEYHEFANKKHSGRSSGEWIEFYDNYLSIANNAKEKERRDLVNKKIFLGFVGAIFSLFILGILIFSSGINITGFAIGDFAISEDSMRFDLVLNESTDLPLELGLADSENIINLKFSGEFSEGGNARILFENKVIFDSSLLESDSAFITGDYVNEQGVRFFQISNACYETCNLSDIDIDLDNSVLHIELENATLVLGSLDYQTISISDSPESEEEIPTISIVNETNISEEKNNSEQIVNFTEFTPYEDNFLIQGEASLDKPVQWTLRILGNRTLPFDVSLPSGAKFKEVRKTSVNNESGEIIAVQELDGKLILDKEAEAYEIIYETSAPIASEKIVDKRVKQVTISGPTELHYTNVRSFTNIDESLNIRQARFVRLFWIVDNEKRAHDFNVEDTNGNGIVDRIAWNTPSLSEQTFEIIVITNAEHLDLNRAFISNVYEEVRTLDGIWSEPIQDGEYVRVTFERALNSKKDITLYPRIVSGNPEITVYERDSDESLTRFSPLLDNQYNQVFLTNLLNSQDTFDLQVTGGTVEIDHIIDPVTLVTLVPNNVTSPVRSGAMTENSYTISTIPGNQPHTCYVAINATPLLTCLENEGTAALDAFFMWNVTLPANEVLYSVSLKSIAANTAGVDKLNISLWNYTASRRLSFNWTNATTPVRGRNFTLTYNLTNAFYKNFLNASSTQLIFTSSTVGGSADDLLQEYFEAVVVYEGIAVPVVNLKGPANATSTNATSYSFNATLTDNVGLFNATLYIWNQTGVIINQTGVSRFSASNDSNITFTFPYNGTFFWNYLAIDNATGANRAMNISNWTVFYRDIIFPLVTINEPSNITYNASGMPVLFNVTLNEGAFWCNYTLDGGVFNYTMTNVGDRYFNGSNATIADGGYSTTYYCWDFNNNLNNSVTRSFSVDTTAPVVTINAPLANRSISSVLFNVTTNEDASAALLSLDGGITNISMQKNGARDFNYTNSSIADGIYTLNYYVNDSSYNVNRSTSKIFLIDTILPLINYSSGMIGDGSTVAQNYIFVNVTLTEINLRNITYLLKNNTGIINFTSFTTGVTNINWSGLGYTNYSFNVTIIDTAGNVNATTLGSINLAEQASNTAPAITFVQNSTLDSVSITESTFTSLIVNFTAFDADGASDLNSASSNLTIMKFGEAVRQNASCGQLVTWGSYANYSCMVKIWWFDSSGAWTIRVGINDSSGSSASNVSTNFTLAQTTAFVASSSLAFSSINPGANNQTTSGDVPILLNNTGNKNISDMNIQINATDLVGEVDSGKAIYAKNFSVSIFSGVGSACALNTNMTSQLNKSDFQYIANATLTRGNFTINDGTGQEQLYLCIRQVGSELNAQPYSTLSQGSWTIRILSIGLAFRLPRRNNRRNKKLKEDNLVQAMKLIADELKEKYSMSKEETLSLLVDELREKYDLTQENVARLVRKETKKVIRVPISVFSAKLGALESVCKYLHENEGMKYSEIARAINRDDRTVWTACNKAKKKEENIFVIDNSSEQIPLSVMNDERFTILESLILHLKERGLSYKEIGLLLGRDQRNVWTIHSNAVRKN